MENTILKISDLSVTYPDHKTAVSHITADIPERQITSIMGPSGCGKSTLLRAINLMHSLYKGIGVSGRIEFRGQDLLRMEPGRVRRAIGMVFQRPNPFPNMTIYENVLAGYTLNNIRLSRQQRDAIVEQSLKSVALWNEVADTLNRRGTFLSGGQQQRLCIARALALRPDIILMDEPTSALDPIATAKIEELLMQLKNEVTIVIVTHNMGQASRISDRAMFMYLGELVEYGDTAHMFQNPTDSRTRAYLTGQIS